MSLSGIPLTLDPGFDGALNHELIRAIGMVPVIKPNFRNTKDKNIIRKRTRLFKKHEVTYRLRHAVERSFAWEDKYRKLVIRYERLETTFKGFRYLAAALINFRSVFRKGAMSSMTIRTTNPLCLLEKVANTYCRKYLPR